MSTKKKDEDVILDELSITLDVDDKVIDKVLQGEITDIVLRINEDNQDLLLETIDGKPVMEVEELPKTDQGCYFYHGSEFPYVIKSTLNFLILAGPNRGCLSRIIGIETEPGTRFNYQGKGKPIKEDPNGDNCIWKMILEIVPLPPTAKTYLMRWNPSISSFTEKDYKECVDEMIHGMFFMNWSINEWEEARRGDLFYMLRVGDDKAGIVCDGQFISDPYPDEDWNGSTKRRMYVDMVCMLDAEPGDKPHVSLERLQKSIPDFDWAEGHSGVLLPDEVVDELVELCKEE